MSDTDVIRCQFCIGPTGRRGVLHKRGDCKYRPWFFHQQATP